jgi:hypothetical protein
MIYCPVPLGLLQTIASPAQNMSRLQKLLYGRAMNRTNLRFDYIKVLVYGCAVNRIYLQLTALRFWFMAVP